MAFKFTVALAVARLAAAAIDFAPCPQLNEEIQTQIGTELPTFDCANVSVPLDYTDDDSESLQLNVFRINATEEPVLGNILINFGGPGGTGAEGLPAWANRNQLSSIIGTQWNLISWDPRGTGNTIPFRCTPETGLLATTNTKRDLESLVSINGTEGFLNYGWELAGGIADDCAAQANDTGSLIGTAFVARDVIEIVDALDDGDLLNYYGWSYGTALGSYIAAMFPERIGRMVLDGNVNPHDYQSGTYADAAADIDQTLNGFLKTCFEAQEDCSLYNLIQPNSTEDILSTINSGLSLYSSLANSGSMAYQTWIGLKNLPIADLYFPRLWPGLADTLTLLLNSTTPPTPPNNTEAYGDAVNAVLGIRASDATFHANSSEEYLPVLERQTQSSESFGDAYYLSLWVSARWQMPAKERYWGNFRTETENPILYVNGEYDPVTPIVGAYNGSRGFAGSVVLAHTGYGHGLLAAPSQCANRHIQRYLQNGTLPSNGTSCEPDASTLEVWRAVVQGTTGTSNGTNNGTDGSSSSSNPDSSSTSDSDEPSGSGAPSQGENAGSSIAPSAVFTTAVSGAMLLGFAVLNL